MKIDLNQTISKDISGDNMINITCNVKTGRVILYLKEKVMVNGVQNIVLRDSKDITAAKNSPGGFSNISKSTNGTGNWQLEILGQVNGTDFSISGDVTILVP